MNRESGVGTDGGEANELGATVNRVILRITNSDIRRMEESKMAFHRGESREIRELARKIDQRLKILFRPPERKPQSSRMELRDRGLVCRHGRFSFESCKHCNRTKVEAQAELERLRRCCE